MARRVVLPYLPTVRARPAGWFKPVEAWYAWQAAHRGRVKVHGMERYWQRGTVPNWGWPPVPGQAAYGWRARLVMIAWRRRWVRRWGWCPRPYVYNKLVYLEKGVRPVTLWDLRWFEARWAERAAKSRTRQRPHLAVNLSVLGGGRLGLGWRS